MRGRINGNDVAVVVAFVVAQKIDARAGITSRSPERNDSRGNVCEAETLGISWWDPNPFGSDLMRRAHVLIIAGAVAALTGTGALVARFWRTGGDGPTDVSRSTGSSANDVTGASPDPAASPANIAAALETWKNAILVRDPETVLTLDRAFQSDPDRYAPALEEQVKHADNERVRAFSLRVLGKLKDPRRAPQFEVWLADPSPLVRQNAAWALGELGGAGASRAATADAVPVLRRAEANDPAADVRLAAKTALEKIASPTMTTRP